jgi:hypothetical protein
VYKHVPISPYMQMYWAMSGDLVLGTMFLPKSRYITVQLDDGTTTSHWLALTRDLMPEEVLAYAGIDVRRATLFNRDTFHETPVLVRTEALQTALKKTILAVASDVERPRTY